MQLTTKISPLTKFYLMKPKEFKVKNSRLKYYELKLKLNYQMVKKALL